MTKVHRQYVITSGTPMSSDDLLYEKLKVFFYSFLTFFFLSSLLLLCLFPALSYCHKCFFLHIFFLLCLQPFVIHDMKSLMEGEQFINCRQIPILEHQQHTSALTHGHAGQWYQLSKVSFSFPNHFSIQYSLKISETLLNMFFLFTYR